jgi:hypothetical protein
MDNIIQIKYRSNEQANAAFSAFMAKAEKELNDRAKKGNLILKASSKSAASDLENLSVQVMKEVSPNTPFRADQIQLVSGHRFPDILAEKYYGVEVKSTKGDHWTSIGSSIVESTRLTDVENIYLLFGKLGGKTSEFKCRPYQDCMSEIVVTHSPRYSIDMDLRTGESIFAKMGVSYNDLRNSPDTIEQVRDYYRKKAIVEKKAEMPWWLESPTNMTVRLWNDGAKNAITTSENEKLSAKMFILFPEVFKSDFKRAAMWLCTRYSVLLYNARDIFSAGGQFTHIDNKRLKFKLPHIVGELLNHSKQIKYFLNNTDLILDEIVEFNPDLMKNASTDLYDTWLNRTNAIIQNLTVPKEHKTIAQLGGIPFVYWFMQDKKMQIYNTSHE